MAAMALLLYNPIVRCIGNKLLIVEGGDFHICYANIRSSLRLNFEIHAHKRKKHKLRIPVVKHNFAEACVRYQLQESSNSMSRSIRDKVYTLIVLTGFPRIKRFEFSTHKLCKNKWIIKYALKLQAKFPVSDFNQG